MDEIVEVSDLEDLEEELEEEEVELLDVGEIFCDEDVSLTLLEDFLHKNTASFQCLTQIEISRSSLLNDPFFFFPEIEDPNYEEALWASDEESEYDDAGIDIYKKCCKEKNVLPFIRVINSLPTETMDLNFYSLSNDEFIPICEALKINTYIHYLYIEENWLKPESLEHLRQVIEICNLRILNMRHCHMGVFGAMALEDCFEQTRTLTELDLSNNDLGDKGLEALKYGLKNNNSIKYLNLSHNDLGDGAGLALLEVLEDNYMIRELDLSWNFFFTPIGMKALMEGLTENIAVTKLNLSWNGIGNKDTFRYIFLFLKSENNHLQHLDLSNNRISDVLCKMIRGGLKFNDSLITIDLSNNPIKPSDVELICGTFFDKRELPSPLKQIDFKNAWVEKDFLKLKRKIVSKDCTVTYAGVLENYKIKGPNVKEVLLERAKVVAMKPKKKKMRRDIGEFIIQFPEESIPKDDFMHMVKKEKIKLDQDLKDAITTTFEFPKKKVNLKDIKDVYLKLYPDTIPPPPKKKKGKKGKDKEKKEKKEKKK